PPTARPRLLAHDLDEPLDRPRTAGRTADADLVEQPEAVGDEYAAGRGRRVRVELVAQEGRLDGSAAHDAVLGQVGRRELTAEVADDRVGEIAPVELGSASLGEQVHRSGEVGGGEPIAHG